MKCTENRKENRKKLKIVCVIMVLGFCECFFFRKMLGNDLLFGDRGDGRLTNLLAEHWWRFFQGKEKFSELLMFHPVQRVSGYTDMLLGHGIIYSLFRMTGMNLYISYKYALIFMHSLGTASMFYLMRNKLKTSCCWSLFGTMAFCYSDSFARHTVHTQLIAVSMLPVLLIFLMGFVQNFKVRRKRNIYAYLFMSWFALLTYTAWYVAFFAGMFSLVFLLSGFIRWKRDMLFVIKNSIFVIRYDLIGYMIFFIVIYIPFIYVYLPVLQLSSGYSYSDVSIFLPEVIDLINVSDSNYMMGWLMRLLQLDDRGYSGEVAQGYSCVLLLLFFWMFFAVVKNRQASKISSKQQKWRVLENVFLTVVICQVLIMRLGSNGVSLWAFVYKLLPVARSIRAVARFLLWLSFPMAVVTAYCADQYFRIRYKKFPLSAVFAVLIFVSNIHTGNLMSGWSAGEELAFIKTVSVPPEDAKIFYLIDSEKQDDAAYIYQMDAFEIAMYHSRKTINGYSGQSPNGWDGIWDVCSDAYEGMVHEWVHTYDLKNVYAYDRAANKWISFEDRTAVCQNAVFWPAENKFSISSGLKDFNQGEYVWTDLHFKTKIKNAEIQKSGLVIKLSVPLAHYMSQNPELEPYIRLYADGSYIRNIPVKEGYAEYRIPMQDHGSDEYEVELKTNCYFNPEYIGMHDDKRDLSLALYYIGN